MKFSFNNRKLRYGSASVLFVAIVVAVVIVFNIFADFLTDRFSLKVDMTEEGIYSLSEDTRAVLGDMTENVKIYILSSQAELETDDSAMQMLETIRRFKSVSGGRVDYEFVDTRKNPQFVAKYPKVRNATVRDLVVEGAHRYIVLDSDEFTGTSSKKNKLYYRTEEQISAAVLYVTAEEIVNAGFVTGHEEIIPDTLYSHFEGNNFEIHGDVDLLSEVPEEITNLVISAPRRDFSEEEIRNLEKYLGKTGNTLYVFWGVDAPKLPVLERYLAEWGFEILPQVVCDEKNSYSKETYVVADLLETDIIDRGLQGQSYIIAPETRPIKVLFDESGYTWTTELARTRDTSYAKRIDADKNIETLAKTNGDEDGPFTVFALSQRSSSSGVSTESSKVFVFGTYAIAIDEISAIPRAFNGTLLARTVDYANPNTRTLTLSPKAEISYDLEVSKGDIRAISIVLIGVIPLIFVALGIFIYIKRKNR